MVISPVTAPSSRGARSASGIDAPRRTQLALTISTMAT